MGDKLRGDTWWVYSSPLQPHPLSNFCTLKRQGREADQLSPSNADVKNGGAITPLPHTSSWRGAWLIKPVDNLPLLSLELPIYK
jgi:hypothetical protein